MPQPRWSAQATAQAGTAETLRRLDDLLSGMSAEELTFAECFTRWDSGANPLIVDRLSLSGAGYGPRSRCVPLGADPRGQPLCQRTLQQYGLTLVPIDSVLLVTSLGEASRFESGAMWLPALSEVRLWGSDRSDRFQSVARWRGELTPAETLASGLADPLRTPPGWAISRFSASSWPSKTTRVEILDERSGLVPGLVLAVALLAMLSYMPLSPRWGVSLPIALLVFSVLLHLWMPDSLANLTAGIFLGAMVSLLHRLGGQIAALPGRQQRQSARRSGPPARLPRKLFRAAPLAFAVFLISHDHAEAQRGEAGLVDSKPILALFPYEGTYDPGKPPLKVVFRESDYQLLKGLARHQPNEQAPLLVLTGATHHVTRTGDRDAVLSSELSIRATTPGSATWRLPVAGARDITATLEGSPVPVFIEGDGKQASIPIQGPGTVRVLVRRTATVSRDGTVESLDFPVNPLPSARLIVEGAKGSSTPRLLNARGSLKVGPGPAITAELGPTDHVEIQWGTQDNSGPAEGVSVEGVMLWDIEPAGDRIQARLTYRGDRRTSTIRLKMDPGLIVKSARIPGMINSAWSGASDQPVWTARLDPPLADGAMIELDLWRPLDSGQPVKTRGPARETSSAESVRRFPRLEPLQTERFTSLLGVRRPSHWTGRLEAPMGTEAISDEAFVKTWGPLPDERLTLSGTARLVRDKLPTFRTGPAPALIRIRPTLELRVDAGRIDVVFEAEIVDLGGSVSSLAVTVPEDLVVLGVESDGLTDWSRPETGQLLLRFDRVAVRSRRKLKITGWLPTVEDPLKIGVQQLRMPTPWLFIPGMETLPGNLVIASKSRIDATGARGMTLVSTDRANPAVAAETRTVQSYRVDDPARLGSLAVDLVTASRERPDREPGHDSSGFRGMGGRAPL